MAYERSESPQDNFGKFIYQFQAKTKTLNRKLKRILIKLYRQNVSLLFNQTCLYIYIYINLNLLWIAECVYIHTHSGPKVNLSYIVNIMVNGKVLVHPVYVHL